MSCPRPSGQYPRVPFCLTLTWHRALCQHWQPLMFSTLLECHYVIRRHYLSRIQTVLDKPSLQADASSRLGKESNLKNVSDIVRGKEYIFANAKQNISTKIISHELFSKKGTDKREIWHKLLMNLFSLPLSLCVCVCVCVCLAAAASNNPKRECTDPRDALQWI